MRAEGAKFMSTGATASDPQLGVAGSAPAGAPAAPLIEVDGLHHAFGEVEALRGLSLRAGRGEVVGLVGPSGCGKSTLLELLCGLAEPTGGRLSVAGATDPEGRLGACAYMPQRDLLLPWYSALDNAALALRNAGMARRQAREQAAALFPRFGLEGFEQARPAELSGGMRQRVAFLRTLVAGKPVLLLDEPFASLDAITRAGMQEWLAEALQTEPRTVVLVTHDVEEALYLCDRVAILSGRPGRVIGEAVAPGRRRGPRDADVTRPGFLAEREEALRLLRAGARNGQAGEP
jgi:NitT/TauT family transport system ATP-binding protein